MDWVQRCVVGGVTKNQLDKERQKECNSLDQMQNTSFVYHPESLIEMQLMVLLSIFVFTNKDNLEGYDFKKPVNQIMIGLFIEHIFSYGCAIFRSYDIYKNGKIDINGVKRAPTELFISNIQFLIACILIGFSIHHFM